MKMVQTVSSIIRMMHVVQIFCDSCLNIGNLGNFLNLILFFIVWNYTVRKEKIQL